jgi:hypothetical protein
MLIALILGEENTAETRRTQGKQRKDSTTENTEHTEVVFGYRAINI